MEIEGIFNTRPLTYVDFDDNAPMRPIDFISPGSSLMLLSPSSTEEPEFIPGRLST
ncbi:unnamed protein product, partial [Onchocerca ochengi]|uniref:Cytochrome P450 n=1 Tax=Onchocerca ochengi TaxID=42157 RepID=A0A182F096_ONCOC